jgi:hypothetical protein
MKPFANKLGSNRFYHEVVSMSSQLCLSLAQFVKRNAYRCVVVAVRAYFFLTKKTQNRRRAP